MSLCCTWPLPSLSMVSKTAMMFSTCSLRSSSAFAKLISSSCWPVVVIMFSLTTAVRIDRSVQELVIMKNTKHSFSAGTLSMRRSMATDSASDAAPLMTRNKVNMLLGTVLKGFKILSGTSAPGGKPSFFPMRLVARMPIAYKVTMVSTRTHITPCRAAMTPVTRIKRGWMDLTSFARRRMRISRNMRMSIMTFPKLIPCSFL
mmetsp:Transcript_111534/g.204606  ORF Transcript_111534/g.204606 Transcript_111534/m.204606 type:complete len:203 (+) Transcript_111534:607-1215(+)